MFRAATVFLCFFVCLIPLSFTGAQTEACDPDADLLTEGQAGLDAGDYVAAGAAFSCAIEADPLNVDAYRGRIEAALLAGEYAAALNDYDTMQGRVLPEVEDAFERIVAYYDDGLAADADNIALLTGRSFANWWAFEFEAMLDDLTRILELEPDNVYATLFQGSARTFLEDYETAEGDFERVLTLAPDSANVHFILSDAYLYGFGDVERALAHAMTAADLGLDTARLDAIFASTYFAEGDVDTALEYFTRHIERTTTEMAEGEPLVSDQPVTLAMTPGSGYRLPVEVEAGESLHIWAVGSPTGLDSFLVLLGPDGEPFTGNDDTFGYNAAILTEIPEAGTYTLVVATFMGAGEGDITLIRE